MSFTTILLGLLSGAVVTVSMLLANLVAARTTPAQSLLDVGVRLGIMGVILLPLASLLGDHFSYLVRSYSITFLVSLSLGYLTSSWALYFLGKHNAFAKRGKHIDSDA